METVDIIREVVEAINSTFTAKTITDNLDGTFTLTTCDTLHLQDGFPLKINGNDYEIITVTKDASILISGAFLPAIKIFPIYLPTYYHGSVIKVQAEISGGADASNLFARTPFIYLKEILTDKNNSKYNQSPIEKVPTLQMLFLTQCKYTDWKIVDHYAKSIQQMRNLVDRFILSLYADKRIGKFQDYDTVNHVNFGVWVTDKGEMKHLFNDNLSGIELKISPPILKQNAQCNVC